MESRHFYRRIIGRSQFTALRSTCRSRSCRWQQRRGRLSTPRNPRRGRGRIRSTRNRRITRVRRVCVYAAASDSTAVLSPSRDLDPGPSGDSWVDCRATRGCADSGRRPSEDPSRRDWSRPGVDCGPPRGCRRAARPRRRTTGTSRISAKSRRAAGAAGGDGAEDPRGGEVAAVAAPLGLVICNSKYFHV